MKKLILLTLTCLSLTAMANTDITDFVKVRFADLDADNNGSLSLTELRATSRDWMTKAGFSEAKQISKNETKMTQLDINLDKKISIEEFAVVHKK
ncbi:EF-hand domain-containing protein [Colwellia piezophila]|uniref:EF-hand domain-containing protein n=1 Tax=Colwellia piezophila TaxID=211668 RepID=UPI00037E2109|nr:EF-hand domain-containing protein [Colwellia piezophila]